MKKKVDTALKNKQTVADFFNAVLQTHPNKEAIVFVDKQGGLLRSTRPSARPVLTPMLLSADHLTSNIKTSYTYAEVEAESNKGMLRLQLAA